MSEMIREFITAAHFDLNKVQLMLAENPDLLHSSFEWSPGDVEDGLMAAAHMGNRPIAEFFLDRGLPLTIFAAAMLGQYADVQRFLAEDANLAEKKGAHGFTLMWHAALSGDTRIIQAVADCGGKFNSFELHAAINSGKLDAVRWMLDHGANDLSVKNFQQKTPLQVAEELGLTEIAEVLKG